MKFIQAVVAERYEKVKEKSKLIDFFKTILAYQINEDGRKEDLYVGMHSHTKCFVGRDNFRKLWLNAASLSLIFPLLHAYFGSFKNHALKTSMTKNSEISIFYQNEVLQWLMENSFWYFGNFRTLLQCTKLESYLSERPSKNRMLPSDIHMDSMKRKTQEN